MMDGVLGNRPLPAVLSAESVLRLPGPDGFAFSASHAAVAAVLVTMIAAPYLTRKLAGLGRAVGVAEVYEGRCRSAYSPGCSSACRRWRCRASRARASNGWRRYAAGDPVALPTGEFPRARRRPSWCCCTG